MGRRAAVLVLTVAATLALASAAASRLILPGHELGLLSNSAALAARVVPTMPPGPEYVNFRPLIGILSQACHSCPGK